MYKKVEIIIFSGYNIIKRYLKNVYNTIWRKNYLKRREFIKRLEQLGFVFERHGSNHDIYVRGNEREEVPRHKEINERLANVILKKRASKNV